MAYKWCPIKIMLDGLLSLVSLLLACNFWIIAHTQKGICKDISHLPPCIYGLVLGTSPKRVDGAASAFFDKRIEAAALLYQQGKVQRLILSGIHDRQYYNEPIAMQKALLKLGVPQKAIILDIEGVNTLASIKRVKASLGIDQLVIITQRFHGYRALYISRHCGVEALVFASEDAAPWALTRTLFREFLARVKALIDLHVLQKHHCRSNNEED